MNRFLYQLLFAFLIIFNLSKASSDSSESVDSIDIDFEDIAESIADGVSVAEIAQELLDEFPSLDEDAITDALEQAIAEAGSNISEDELEEIIGSALAGLVPTEEPDADTEAEQDTEAEDPDTEAEDPDTEEVEVEGDVVLINGTETRVIVDVDGDTGFASGAAGILNLCQAVGGECSVTQTTVAGTTLTVLSCGIGVQDASAIFMASEGEENECGITVDIEESTGIVPSSISDSDMGSSSAAGAAACIQAIADALATLNCTGEAGADLPPATEEEEPTAEEEEPSSDCPCIESLESLLEDCEDEECTVEQISLVTTTTEVGCDSASLVFSSDGECEGSNSTAGRVEDLTQEQQDACAAIIGGFVAERAANNESCSNEDAVLGDSTFASDDSAGLRFCIEESAFVQTGDRGIILRECRSALIANLDGIDSDCCDTIATEAASDDLVDTCETLLARCVANACRELVGGDQEGDDVPAASAAGNADNEFDQYEDFYCAEDAA